MVLTLTNSHESYNAVMQYSSILLIITDMLFDQQHDGTRK
jgi:hypothetical protein